MKKVFSWLFRDSLELNKRWWHRLIKVLFISIFCLAAIAIYISLITDPSREFLGKHNIHVRNNLYEFTENYTGEDYENTIPKFFAQKGQFGLMVENEMEYVSAYLLGNSFCMKTPEKYLDGITKVLYPDFVKGLSYEDKGSASIEKLGEYLKKQFYEDTTRKCYFYDLNDYDENIKKVTNLSRNIINYQPNAFFYAEVTLVYAIAIFLAFLIFAAIYYRVILYIVFGSKK